MPRSRRRPTLGELRLLAPAALTVAAVRLALWTLPFRVVRGAAARLAVRGTAAHARCSLDRLVWAVHVASRYVPHATCLTQSLAAQVLLGRHGYAAELRLGVAREAGQFDAHAWVESDGRTVIGHATRSRYTAVT